jgi:hypothetical protein
VSAGRIAEECVFEATILFPKSVVRYSCPPHILHCRRLISRQGAARVGAGVDAGVWGDFLGGLTRNKDFDFCLDLVF